MGKGKYDNKVVEFVLGNRTEKADHSVQFCPEHKLYIGNILFDFPAHRLRTFSWLKQ